MKTVQRLRLFLVFVLSITTWTLTTSTSSSSSSRNNGLLNHIQNSIGNISNIGNSIRLASSSSSTRSSRWNYHPNNAYYTCSNNNNNINQVHLESHLNNNNDDHDMNDNNSNSSNSSSSTSPSLSLISLSNNHIARKVKYNLSKIIHQHLCQFQTTKQQQQQQQQPKQPKRPKQKYDKDVNDDKYLKMNTVSDCYYDIDDNYYYDIDDENDTPMSFHANIQRQIIIPSTSSPSSSSSSSLVSSSSTSSSSLIHTIHNAMNHCYNTSPGAMYTSSLLKREKKKKTMTQSQPSSTSTLPLPLPPQQQEDTEEIIQEPSQHILAGIVKPLIPKSIWESLTGHEFYYPSTLSNLIQTGIRIANVLPSSIKSNDEDVIDDEDGCYVDWKPADTKTKKLFESTRSTNNNRNYDGNHDDDGGDDDGHESIRHALMNEDQTLVWTGKFIHTKNKMITDQGYGSNLPLVKTISIIPLSPRKFAELLMDSNLVQSYNKMSLGRKDVVVFQQGVDTKGDASSSSSTSTSSSSSSSFALDGEAKIVRNVTKPPMSKKLMEFVTLMYARKLNKHDNVNAGYFGGGPLNKSNDNDNDNGTGSSYIVVTRAVSGGRWSVSNQGQGNNNDGVTTRGGSSHDEENEQKASDEEMTRSEILLGVNLLRSIPGEPNKTEVTAVTHVYSPSVPTMLAGTVGVKGAVDFVKDIRALCSK